MNSTNKKKSMPHLLTLCMCVYVCEEGGEGKESQGKDNR